MTALSWVAVAVFAIAYTFIATEWVHRVAAALVGAGIMFVIGATDAQRAFFSPDAGIDWNVIFLLIGMMLQVAVLKRTGLFEYIAIWSAKRARGRPFRVMVILVVVTALVSAALDNVTTVLLVAPVTFLVCQRLAVPAAPFLIADLFIMVGALVNTGVVGPLARAATDATEGRLWLGSMVLLWASSALSAVVDNIPYVATMSPIVEHLVAATPADQAGQVLWWALAIGADLGGNATAVGASANVVVLGVAARAGQPISFWQFTRYGFIVAAVTVALAVPYLYVRFFAFA